MNTETASMVTIENSGECIIARLKGDLDHHNLQDIRRRIDFVLENTEPKRVILDFTNVPFCDSSAIGLILGRIRLAETFGGKIEIIGINEYVAKIMRLAGISSLIK